MKRFILLLLVLLLAVPSFSFADDEEDLDIEEIIETIAPEETPGIVETDGSTTITITCTGDFTIGGDNYHRKDIFTPELKKHDGDINFTLANMKEIFQQDDLTLINFEGTFTNIKAVPEKKKNNQFLFNISPEYSHVLPDNSVEAVCLENNHVMDHGEEGFEETKDTLRNAGVVYSTSDEIGIFEAKGIQIAMLSYLCIDRYYKPVGGFDNLFDKVAHDITVTKEKYPIVIVSFHWGKEKYYTPTDDQVKMGRLAVDSGADLVIGHHSHRMNPIEQYKGVYICYSLGNFCFSGNSSPSDMNSFVFQTRFRMSKTGDITNTGFRIIPIRITSLKDKNDFVPTPITDDMKIVGVVNTLKDNGRKLEYGVTDYPLEWN